MVKISGAEGPIILKQHDPTTAFLKPDSYISGATAFDANEPAGQFFYQSYQHALYTIFTSTMVASYDLTLRVEYGRPFLGFRLMVKNHIRYQLNNKHYYLMQGQLNFVSAPIVESELLLVKDERYKVFDLHIELGLIQRIKHKDQSWSDFLANVRENQTVAFLDGPGFGSIQMMDLMEELLKNPGNESLVLQLVERVIEARTMKREYRPITETQIESLFRVKDMIRKQIAGKQHLRDWAREAGMNITYFKEYFKLVFGITPYHYLMYERIREAKKMIRHYPELTLSEIAEACGFSNYNNLRRAFYSMEKITLSRWQRLSDIAGIMLVL